MNAMHNVDHDITHMLPEGVHDLLPPHAGVVADLNHIISRRLAAFGYDRVNPPLVEYEQALSARMKGARPKNMLRMVDPQSLQTLALRSDMTVQIGRMAATTLRDVPRPLRLSYSGPVLRLSTDPLTHERERLQIGAECIGSDDVAAAQEILALAVDSLMATGLTRLTLDICLPDLVDRLAKSAFPLAEDRIEAVRRELDTKDAGGLVALGDDAAAYLPLLYAMGDFDDAIAQLTQWDKGGELTDLIAGLKQIVAHLPDNIAVTLDPTERHGFEYQSWFGFTLYAAHSSASKFVALGRGGSYHIVHDHGNDDATNEPACGFSLFPERILDIAPEMTEAYRRKKIFLPMGHDKIAAENLREQGWQTIAALGAADDAQTLQCSHILTENGAEPL